MWTEPRTWVTSELVTAAQLNTHVRDNLNETFRAIERSNAFVQVTNTSSELSLHDGSAHTSLTGWTIPAGVMGASRGLRLTITGDAWYGNSDSDDCALGLYVANTKLINYGSLFSVGSPSGSLEGWRCIAEVWNLAANSQIATMTYNNATRSGNSGTVTSTTFGTADTTASWKLDVTADWTTASVQLNLRRWHAVIELI
jgi:hypothetical protein